MKAQPTAKDRMKAVADFIHHLFGTSPEVLEILDFEVIKTVILLKAMPRRENVLLAYEVLIKYDLPRMLIIC